MIKRIKMAKIKITLDKRDNLLSIMLRVGHREKILRTAYGDNKIMIDENGFIHVLHVIEMLTGNTIESLPIEEYTQSYPEDYHCCFIELPVSECGKYLLIDNPLLEGI